VAPTAKSQAARRILVVDDDPSIRFLLRLIFEAAGYSVSEAPHGRAALIRIKMRLPDVVVTDMKMPVMDGGALIEHLRSDPESADIPIVAVTGERARPEPAAKANVILAKPFLQATLVETVNGLLEERGLRAS
jgi:CheY-like chemotaxis protein